VIFVQSVLRRKTKLLISLCTRRKGQKNRKLGKKNLKKNHVGNVPTYCAAIYLSFDLLLWETLKLILAYL